MRYFKHFVIFLVCFQCIALKAQVYNRPVNSELFQYEFQLLDNSFDQYTLITPFHIGQYQATNYPISSQAVILDPKGYAVWYYSEQSNLFMDFKYDEARQQFFTYTTTGGTTTSMLFDTTFQYVEALSTQNGVAIDPHDFITLQNGNYMLMGVQDSIFDLSSYSFGGTPGDPNTTVVCNLLQEFSPTHQLVWEWNSCDVLHPSEAVAYYGYNATNFDYAHINSVFEDNDHHLLASFRHLNSIVKINHNNGQVIWRFGGSNNDFSQLNDYGFSGQHDAQRQPNGLITVFDNGNMSLNPQTSRAVTYELDLTNSIATLVDEYVRQPITYGSAMGNYAITEEYKAVHYGLIYRPYPNVVYLDTANNEVATLTYPDSVMSYRAYIFQPDFSFDRPKVVCYENNGVTYLQAEDGHSAYLWSSGETTREIIPTEGEEYQVWVSYGVGKVSSEAILYTTDYCGPVGVDELSEKFDHEAPQLEYSTDIMGRIVTHKQSGVIYLDVYSDGAVKKSIYWKR